MSSPPPVPVQEVPRRPPSLQQLVGQVSSLSIATTTQRVEQAMHKILQEFSD